jgi:hypothetical protein
MAKSISEILSWIIFSLLLVLTGMNFVAVNYQSIYSNIFSIVLIYLAIGSFVMRHRQVSPPSSKKLTEGKLDLEWGFNHLYWSFWWPAYLKK